MCASAIEALPERVRTTANDVIIAAMTSILNLPFSGCPGLILDYPQSPTRKGDQRQQQHERKNEQRVFETSTGHDRYRRSRSFLDQPPRPAGYLGNASCDACVLCGARVRRDRWAGKL